MRLKGNSKKAIRYNQKQVNRKVPASNSVCDREKQASVPADQAPRRQLPDGNQHDNKEPSKQDLLHEQDKEKSPSYLEPSGRKDLSGTVFVIRDAIWSLGEHIASGFHFDDYSLIMSRRAGRLKSLDLTRYRVRTYMFDDTSRSVAKYRRRHMKRFSKYKHALFSACQDGICYIPFLVDDSIESRRVVGKDPNAMGVVPALESDISATYTPDPVQQLDPGEADNSTTNVTPPDNISDSTSRIEIKKEKAKVKQWARRQRRRTENRDELVCPQLVRSRSNKRHRPTPSERSMTFVSKIYDYDKSDLEFDPSTSGSSTRSWTLPGIFSKSIRAVEQYNVVHERFRDFDKMKEYRKKTMTELAYLKQQQKSIEDLEESIKNRIERAWEQDESPVGILELHHMEIKVEYVIGLLPRLTKAVECQGRDITDRLGRASQALGGNPEKVILRRQLESVIDELEGTMNSSVPMSPAWRSASDERYRLICQLGDLPVVNDESWEMYRLALDPNRLL